MRYERAIQTQLLPTVRAEVMQEYQQQLSHAGLLGRWRIRRRIRAEIKVRLERLAQTPSEYSLY